MKILLVEERLVGAPMLNRLKGSCGGAVVIGVAVGTRSGTVGEVDTRSTTGVMDGSKV
jgi:hypothetical protein